ncbi:hypothetical protein EYF80_017877 [Liparis tanakae]|uniref:Uncharacterized protein n=1 Tax=Liparis tanakae TaxID=230148 RepID=A0A4Z2I207_9TELE|nr:hypothetical protein EYF80_017877 [Liparis tanakae]
MGRLSLSQLNSDELNVLPKSSTARPGHPPSFDLGGGKGNCSRGHCSRFTPNPNSDLGVSLKMGQPVLLQVLI